MDSPEDRDPQIQWELNERRVRGVLARLIRLESSVGPSRARTAYALSPWDWKVAVEMALNRLSVERTAWRGRARTVQEIVMILRLVGNQSFASIGVECSLTGDEAYLIYLFAVTEFVPALDKLNRNGIPDDYTDTLAA